VELQAVDVDATAARRTLPIFERRDGLCYRVSSARLRPASSAETQRFEYPVAAWVAARGTAATLDRTPEGIVVRTDRRHWSYAAHYRPLHAPHTGLYRFELDVRVDAGGIHIGVVSQDWTVWLPSTVNRLNCGGATRLEIAIDLQQGQRCCLVISNDHPDGPFASTVVITRMAGSCDPLTMVEADTSVASTVARAVRRAVAPISDRVQRRLARAVGERFRRHVIETAPETVATEQALLGIQTDVRALLPLRDVADLEALLRAHRPANLHLNGCGDFQMLAREQWDACRGYAEFETFSMNIDGLLSYTACASGVQERMLDMPIFHLEHEVGSGWSPEGEAILKRRIAERGITWLNATTVHIWAAYMQWLRRPMIFNGPDWGMASATLPERVVAARSHTTV
jgi:hypothetical protein